MTVPARAAKCKFLAGNANSPSVSSLDLEGVHPAKNCKRRRPPPWALEQDRLSCALHFGGSGMIRPEMVGAATQIRTPGPELVFIRGSGFPSK